MHKNGFVFINEYGCYARITLSCDHGPRREIVVWEQDLRNATVVPHETIIRRRFKQLEDKQSLKVTEIRDVKINNWEA